MFKKTEETEWTRFSKALSSRDQDESEESADAETSARPAVSPGTGRGESASNAPPARPPVPDTSVASRAGNRSAAASAEEEIESIIGEHTTVDGTFKSENSIRIRGSVQGEIESQRSIMVEEQANVNAKITAETITVAGQVSGQLFCRGRVEIRPSGRVIGEINAGTLIMQEGAFFEGNLKMGERSSQVGAPAPEKAAAKA